MIRPRRLAAGLAAAALLAAACGPSGDRPRKLVYALPVSVPASLAYIAMDKGFFRDEGLDVETKMFSSGREALQTLLAGQAQIQSVSETPVVHAILQGNRVVTIAAISEHAEAKLLARTDRGISRPGDLRGKRVATLPGTNADYFMHRLLAEHGLAPGDLRITNMSPPDMVVALAKGDIDAYFAWEPHIHYGRKALPGRTMVFFPGKLYRGHATVNMDPDFAARNPGTVRAVLRALLKAEEFARRQPQESIALVSRRLDMDPQVLQELWAEEDLRVHLDRSLVDQMTDIGRWAAALLGGGASPPDIRAHIHDQELREEKPLAVQL
ncbi:MAG: ABC transporter substrate-binding protein [Elusimicrobia bacterium]|nr:ABC transporter substrate-binding protein [Elusimicrobiota bacterium]